MPTAYINRWKERQQPHEQHIIDYWFTSDPAKAASWETKEEAESNCTIFDHHRIEVPLAEGGTHICGEFKAEQRAPGEFVVFCLGPFVVDASGRAVKS